MRGWFTRVKCCGWLTLLAMVTLVGSPAVASAAAGLPKLEVPVWTAGPFAMLLLCIAILPLVKEHWWHANRNKGIVAGLLLVPIAITLMSLEHGTEHLVHGLQEYTAFMVLLGSLYIISGGIVVTGDLRAKPLTNVAFLATGAILANIIGTTGASMLLIRPFLKTNSERKNTTHIPLFFIFIVSNCAGLLTPLGDPPLFLGFLQGVDFFWTLQLWPQWLFVNGLLLLVFFIWDMRAYKDERRRDIRRDDYRIEPLRIRGWKLNTPLLVGVIAAVLLKKVIPYFPVCELMMVACSWLSWHFTTKELRKINQYSWGPIVEVAVLFVAIFVTMVPALALLDKHGKGLGVTEPWQFFWLTGVLSSVLDNAPTYVTMGHLATNVGGFENFQQLSVFEPRLLAAISCGAVFMGANSYIGNGPNFMVKAIAQSSGYKMPSFFGYMAFAAMVLLPIFLATMVVSFL